MQGRFPGSDLQLGPRAVEEEISSVNSDQSSFKKMFGFVMVNDIYPH